MKYIHSKTDFVSENNRITKAAGVVAAATLFSRVTGYVRDMIFASFFGVGMISDAFIAAFRIPNLLRRLLGEGSLSLAFIPVFTHYVTSGEDDSAYKLAESALKFLFLCLVFISLVGIILTPIVINFVTPGFVGLPVKMELTVKLTRIMFPYIIFAGTVSLCMGILNVLGHFAIPAVAPVLLNLSMILSLCVGTFFCSTEESLIIVFSFGVLFGGFLQLVLQLPILVKKGIRLWRNPEIWHPGFKNVGYSMLPTVFGSAVYQINVVVSTIFASLLVEGSVACLYYADRIVQFPLGIFAYAFATAVLPSLSRQISSGNHEAVGDTFAHAMNFLLFVTIPATAGLIVLRQPIVELLFGRGSFDKEAVVLTADALLCYSAGLCAFSAIRVVVPVFFALRDTVTPVKMATISIVLNICLGAALMKFMGHCGLALATSIASIINLTTLVFVLSKKVSSIPWRDIIMSTFKTSFCVVFMLIGVINLRRFVIPTAGTGGVCLGVGLFLCIITGILIFMFFAFIIRMPQLDQIMVSLGVDKN